MTDGSARPSSWIGGRAVGYLAGSKKRAIRCANENAARVRGGVPSYSADYFCDSDSLFFAYQSFHFFSAASRLASSLNPSRVGDMLMLFSTTRPPNIFKYAKS